MRKLGMCVVAIVFVGCTFGQPPVGKLYIGRPSFALPVQKLDNRMWVFFVETDTGQGVLIKTPNNKFVIIDTGSEDMHRRMAELLYRLQVTKVEAAFLTSPNYDHIGGFFTLVRDYGLSVGTVYHNGMLHQASNKDVNMLQGVANLNILRRDDSAKVTVDGLVFTPLNPTRPPFVETNDDTANNALVLRMDYRGTSFLFTADVGTYTEKNMLQDEYSKGLLNVDVLQVGSHGQEASTSDEFAAAVSARVAVIQRVADNTAAKGLREGMKDPVPNMAAESGYVHPLVLKALKSANPSVLLLETHELGTVAIISDGRRLVYRAARYANTKRGETKIE